MAPWLPNCLSTSTLATLQVQARAGRQRSTGHRSVRRKKREKRKSLAATSRLIYENFGCGVCALGAKPALQALVDTRRLYLIVRIRPVTLRPGPGLCLPASVSLN
ncbi:hypothetical protein SMAC4_13837 [Sordaria macrospora]|uniref:uncharacterized protein n=1 Tax=Sordaria macrospora TaxID=5147 RepID=UPI002B2D915C|nr:hypothetical protein SMAC4_13837 [Sordaria macrospora]